MVNWGLTASLRPIAMVAAGLMLLGWVLMRIAV
jgi:hypothetical protein